MTGKPREPRGPRGLTREQIADDQRGRLLDAMAEVVAEQGYSGTTVADVIGRAGVSRKTFYAQFVNREECFLAACDMVIEADLEEISSQASLSARQLSAERAIATLFKQPAINPALVRLALVEICALGEQGSLRRERRLLAHEQLLRRSLGVTVPQKAVRSPLLRGLVGGVNEILYDSSLRHRTSELRELVPDVSSWVAAYRSPPPAIVAPPRPLTGTTRTYSITGGRAPGTLSPPPAGNKQRGLRGENTNSHSFVIHSQRERVLDAITILSATKGYATVTVKEIAEHAAISMETFYSHFTSKEDAFLVAFELGHSRALATAEGAYRSAPTWQEGVREAIEALFDFLCSEPTFARLALVEALVATPRICAIARKSLDAFTHILAPGLPVGKEPKPQELILDAVRGGITELYLSYATQGHPGPAPDIVPHATYFALTPFIGSEDAERVALGESQRGRGRDT